jgi:hypothetical protein
LILVPDHDNISPERETSMNVKTNLKAGSTFQTLSQQFGAAADSATGFLGKANQEAKDLSLGTYKVSSSLYNCVTQSLGLS